MAFLEVNFFSDVLGMSMSMNVVLPQKTFGNIGVTEGEFGETYPTMYLLHGMTDDHTTWMRRTTVELMAEERGIAVVMPSTNLGWYTDMKHGPKYCTFIGEELPKICRQMFPHMSKRREDTYICGNSMGGYGALKLALLYPETFSLSLPLSGAFSPEWLLKPDQPEHHDNLYYRDVFGEPESFEGSENDLYAIVRRVKASGVETPKIYMWCGSSDFLIEYNRSMAELLKNEGYDVTYSETPGAHGWIYWEPEMKNVFRFIDNYRKETEGK